MCLPVCLCDKVSVVGCTVQVLSTCLGTNKHEQIVQSKAQLFKASLA